MSLRVLIADDNDLNRWVLAQQLDSGSLEISEASTGAQAWTLLAAETFQLAFIDLNMPLLSGVELIRKIHADDRVAKPYSVAVTANAGFGLRQQLLAEGFDDCLIKPVSLADLQRIIRFCIGKGGELSAQCYADSLLAKVENNHALARVLLEKLFEQVPQQLATLNRLLTEKGFAQALQVAHQLHGSFCFLGFEDFRARALVLEQSLSLVTDDGLDASRQFEILQQEFARLLAIRASLLAMLNAH